MKNPDQQSIAFGGEQGTAPEEWYESVLIKIPDSSSLQLLFNPDDTSVVVVVLRPGSGGFGTLTGLSAVCEVVVEKSSHNHCTPTLTHTHTYTYTYVHPQQASCLQLKSGGSALWYSCSCASDCPRGFLGTTRAPPSRGRWLELSFPRARELLGTFPLLARARPWMTGGRWR